MDNPPITPSLPADYYRRHAARVRQLASEATTLAIKEHLREVAQEYERLAERVENGAPSGTAGSIDDRSASPRFR